MKLYLVRHGETEENVAGIIMGHNHGVLTEKGRQQAKETAEALKNHKFAHIYTSDLARCVHTAEFIKEFHPDTPLTFTKELRERNLGVLQGQSSASIDWAGLLGEDYSGKPENGESLPELKTRALDFIGQIYKEYPEENILLISHNGWIKQVISHYTGVPSKDIAKVGNAQIVEAEVEKDLSGRIVNL